MIIVVDAYNVLKQIIKRQEVNELERNAFLNLMQQYAHYRGHIIVIVFDGGPTEWPTQERINKLYVVYSGYQETADSYIKEYLAKNKAKDVILASSDRELGEAADSLDIPSIDAMLFYRVVQDRMRKPSMQTRTDEPVIKTTTEAKPELDMLMEEASRYIEHKVEDELPVKEKSATKMSKKERRLMMKINKL